MHIARCCQSCGMPLEEAQDFATAPDGSRVDDYCHFCFRHGAFTEPDITAPAMIDRCVALMTRQGVMAEAQARAVMTHVIPTLKRWRGAEGERAEREYKTGEKPDAGISADNTTAGSSPALKGTRP